VISAFLTGFFLGISLIVAIGSQNAFVLRQGIIGQHVFYVALFCAVSDALLISLGVMGISFFLNNLVSEISNILFGFSAVWLSGYGILRLKAVFKSDTTLEIETSISRGLVPTLSIVAILTFANPHVYLDTMILIGSVSQQFSGENKLAYVLGASLASFIFFFSLAYAAKLLAPIMKHPFSWRILDSLIAFIMFTISFKLASAGNWL
jgi:L-lysine exporter family protein LysE/ArgO